MKEYLKFLKLSNIIVKIAAWIVLILGLMGAVTILLGLTSGTPRWMGVVVLVVYAFGFFFFYLIAAIVNLLIKIINEIKKE